MKKAVIDKVDLNDVLLDYRSNPVGDLPAPATLLTGRRLKTKLPMKPELLKLLFDCKLAREVFQKRQREAAQSR